MKKGWKIAGLVAGVLLAFSIGFVLWATLPRSTAKMEEIANQFKPDSSWKLEEESIKPFTPLCLSAHCDELYRRWSLSANLKYEEMLEVIERSGWQLNIAKECEMRQNQKMRICDAVGSQDGYTINLTAWSDYEDESRAKVVLIVSK